MRGRDKIALRVGKVIGHYNMAKHFTIEITDEAFRFTRNTETIAAEAALDGIYVLRTSLPADTLPADDAVLRYQGLEDVERFFRTLNSELDVRPIRTARRLPPPRLRVVSNPHPTNHKPPGQRPKP